MGRIIYSLILLLGIGVVHVSAQSIWNPATNVYILQIGTLRQGDTASGTLYYTRYSDVPDRVKSVDFRYNGYGYLRLENKTTIATTNGADGIVHHPDGDLLIGGQGNGYVHKVDKSTGQVVRSVTDDQRRAGRSIEEGGGGIYHLMMDIDNTVMWGAGIPGHLFRFPADNPAYDRLQTATRVDLSGDDTILCTISWDQNRQAYYTSSDYNGVGNFGVIDMQTFKTQRIYSGMIGAHGMYFDTYSNTMMIFGDQHVIQIDPDSGVVADLDFSKWFSSIHQFRFDQGTGDGEGHLYIADNNGYLAFLDYTSSLNKRIDEDVLIHVQFLDNELDDVAPLSGVGSEDHQVVVSSGSGFSSQGMSSGTNVWVSSSSVSSSSSKPAESSSSLKLSSSLQASSSSLLLSSSSFLTGESSSSEGQSGSLSSSSNNAGSSSNVNSSSAKDQSSSGAEGLSSSSSGGGVGDSSATGVSGSGGSPGEGSSDSHTSGSGSEIPDWADSNWNYDGWGDEIPDDGGLDDYPTEDKRKVADSSITTAQVLVPLQPGDMIGRDTIRISGNLYKTENPPGEPLSGFSPSSGGMQKDSVPVGSVIEITLDISKLKQYFGTTDSIKVSGTLGMQFYDPNQGGDLSDDISIPLGESTNTIWVTSDTVIASGYITFTAPDGRVLRYDGISFYDPIPDPVAGFLKDSDGNDSLDAIEVFLESSLDTLYFVDSVDIHYNGKIVRVGSDNITLSGDRSRFTLDVSGIPDLVDYDVQPEDILQIYFSDGYQVFERELPLQNVMQGIIARAVVIRGLDGKDSLFVEFNIDITSQDILFGDRMILVNGQEIDPTLLRLPTKRTVIFEGLDLNWTTEDSVQLHELASFRNLEYIVDEEYDRKVPVEIIDRIPAITSGGGYYDTNGDGVMDSIVVQFSDALTQEQVDMLHFSIPWYSYRNRLIQLLPQSGDLILDSENPSLVSWTVQSNVSLREGLTTLPETLPFSELYVYYPIFDQHFIEHREFALQDKMAPAIQSAKIRYAESGDTLIAQFSEVVDYSKISRLDVFKYVHGEDTLILRPQQLLWPNDGRSVKIVLYNHIAEPVIPGDWLLARGENAEGGLLIDILENVPLRDTKPVMIDGGLDQLVHISNMGRLSKEKKDSLALVSSMSVQWVSMDQRASDLREQGKVGQLIELGQRFKPQLVAQSGIDPDSLDAEDVSMTISAYYFDNIGQYVTDTVMIIGCTDPAFGGNCLNTDQKLFIDWNFKDARGRYVGSGIYVVNFNLFVEYEAKNENDDVKPVKIKESHTEKVGVRRTH